MYNEYTDFKFGNHWASEYGLVVVSDGDRYTPPTYGNISSNTSTVAGKQGVYKWRTQFAEKIFTVKLMYENLDMRNLSRIKRWLRPDRVQKLYFNDMPHIFYYATLNSDPQFEFLPFFEKRVRETESGDEEITVDYKVLTKGVYKGELTLEFIAIDGIGYSEYGNYYEVEIAPNKTYTETEYDTLIMPWVQTSNLLNNADYSTLRLYTKAFNSGDITLGYIDSKRIHLLNSGDKESKLSLSFNLIVPTENNPLIIYTKRVRKAGELTWQNVDDDATVTSAVVINNFLDYIPFQDFLGEDYDTLIAGGEGAEDVKEKYRIVIDSELREIYLQDALDNNRILNLNKFHGNRDFLILYPAELVDYEKPFPKMLDDEGEPQPAVPVYSQTAIGQTIFNEIFTNSADYELANINFNWKHTYF